MSDSVLNDSLDGDPHEPYVRTPAELISIQGNPTGRIWAYRHSSHDLLNFEVNLKDYSRTNRDTLIDFYREHYGAYDTFLWKDPVDYEIAEYVAIASFGSEDDFQIVSTYGSETVNRYNIISGSETVKYNDVTKENGVDYSLDVTDDGSVVFINDPGNGHHVDCSAEFYRRCRFTRYSEQELTNSLVNIKLNFMEVIPDLS